MESLLQRQNELIQEINRIGINFAKDSANRKTKDYIDKRVTALDQFWGEFEQNNQQLLAHEDDSEYFVNNIYQQTKDFYEKQRKMIASYPPFLQPVPVAVPGSIKKTFDNNSREERGTDPAGPVDELLSQQRTYFRALSRVIKRPDIKDIEEKWEIEDLLKDLQHRWRTIDELHMRIDNILEGSDHDYEDEFMTYETMYNKIKRQLNRKLSSTSHLQQSTPKIDIPVFSGKYSQWPTFFDLFNETIHNNNSISNAQKMQYLKGKLRGEAERLIQHLNISAENYETARDLLMHRYNNTQVLFTNQIEIFLSQPSVHRQTSFELKRLYDTTMESIHAIHNLGVDTTSWDPLIVHLICKKLDAETYADYKQSRKSPRELPSFEELMNFIESKFTALEPITKKDKDTEPRPSCSPKPTFKPVFQKRTSYKPYHQVVATYTPKCALCEDKHDLYQCKRFLNMSPEIRLTSIAKHEICQNCLYKHNGKPCNSTKRCKYCNEYHNSVIHDDILQSRSHQTAINSSPTTSTSNDKRQTKPHGNKPHSVNHVAADDEEILLTTVSLRVKASDGSFMTLRALLDQGSQISLISENAAQTLGLQRRHINASVSGIGTSNKSGKGIVTIDCQSLYEDYSFTTQALVISRVINCLPNNTFSKQSWPHLQNINLADPNYNISKPIDLLLDASVYSDIIMSGLIKGPLQAPIAQQTRLGWILSGNVRTFNCHVVINEVDDISKFWEVEGIQDNASNMSEQDQYCEELYQATTQRLDTGRYQVALPMKQGFEDLLGTSRPKAIMQFKQLEKRMSKNDTLSTSYHNFMEEYLQLGHMSHVNESTGHATPIPTCYLPHHGVLNMDSTSTKFRTVFNASSKTSSGHSLNDLMECGPNLQQDLQGLILLWRTHKYVITADIEKMFRQILIREQDTSLQTIVWRSTPEDPLREYRLTTVTYGTKAAPFLAIRTLRQIAQDHAEDYPLAAAALESSFYMDDLMSGHDDKNQVKELQGQLIKVLQGAGMNLRKWSSNSPDIINDLPSNQISTPLEFRDAESRKTLGLRWNPSSDSFSFQNKIDYNTNDTQKYTKRQLLSDISKIYDPLGWLSPITIKAKIIFQQTWLTNLQWDDKLPNDIQAEWQQLRDDLKNIERFQIDRYLGDKQNYQLHGFCDASEKAYACAVYITTCNSKGEYTTRLVMAKTKLAPHNKQISLPRLELLGALLLSQLLKKVAETISVSTINAWTDSMVVLGWLNGDVTRWKAFVANRVRQITDVIPASQWHHVRSEDNAADCATRGLSSKSLQEHKLWWEGPLWLNTPTPCHDKPSIKIETPLIEVKKSTSVNTALHQSENIIIKLLQDNSSLTRVTRIVGWISRFITRLRHRECASTQNADTLTTIELKTAQNIIIKNIQSLEFEDDIYHLKKEGRVRNSSKISSLNPYIDQSGLLRIGGRLEHASIAHSAKHPVIIPGKNRLTDLIINQAHVTTLHGGPRLTLSLIRHNYWIIGGIRVVKKIIRQCIKCRRFSQETSKQIMADLPWPRVNPSRPFTNTGVDFTGHVEVKANKGRGIKTTKGYIAVFVCLATKAVHLELVSDLSTPAFLAAFRRMCARRGTPRHVYSDNGTNFVGADKTLRQEYKAILDTLDTSFIKNINELDVTWHFNAPSWPSAGGLWESAVKSMKFHLKRVLGDQKLTYEEFITLLHQIEACMNSRPLCPLSEDPDDEVLTPGHFLVGDSLLVRPQTDPDAINLPARWHLVQTMNKHFWRKWSNAYLQHLQTRSKWRQPSENMKVDDIVVIKEDNMPPGKWAIGRILEVHPGKDGFVRVVSLKTQHNVIKRPITKLVKLPVHDDTQNDEADSRNEHAHKDNRQPKRQTRLGGGSKKTFMSNFILLTLVAFMSILSPSMQQDTTLFNITAIDESQNLYFDKISDLRHIKDEWKLVIYYNMTSYWHGLSAIKQYVTHVKSLCHVNTPHDSTVTQLQHEINEIEHYDNLLRYQNKRVRRGLVNGIGYLANSLFGVLDERFADQYKNDIEAITRNENHLQALIKNQTLVIESEYNIIKRNEEIMNKQVKFIKSTLKNLTWEVGQVRIDNQNSNYIIASSLAASIILTNLRRMQDVLLNTITDISQGHIDIHLFSPEQLEQQMNIISGQLHGDLALPNDISDIRQIFKLLKVFGRVIENYLIIEVRIPLVSNEVYELNKIVTVPQRERDRIRYVISSYQYIAFDLKKDAAFLLTEHHLQTCISTQKDTILCSLDEPIYDLKIKSSICNIKLIANDATTSESPCSSHVAPCTADKWIKLHPRNSWLYSCCDKCMVRLFCATGTAVHNITGTGVITLVQGCVVKGETFTIRSHNDFLSKMHQQIDIVEVPKTSILNTIINSSYVDTSIPVEDHQLIFNQLQRDIDQLKEKSSEQINVHDIHHYSITYILLAIILIITCCAVYYWRFRGQSVSAPADEEPIGTIPHAVSTFSVDRGTSPTPMASQRFRVPTINV